VVPGADLFCRTSWLLAFPLFSVVCWLSLSLIHFVKVRAPCLPRFFESRPIPFSAYLFPRKAFVSTFAAFFPLSPFWCCRAAHPRRGLPFESVALSLSPVCFEIPFLLGIRSSLSPVFFCADRGAARSKFTALGPMGPLAPPISQIPTDKRSGSVVLGVRLFF